MDHVPLPRDWIGEARYPATPYICSNVDECDDFLAFAHLYAKRWNVNEPCTASGPMPWLFEAAASQGVSSVEAFLQRWIFFGLLREILEPADLYQVSDYIDHDTTHVHTRYLGDKVRAWTHVVESWSEGRKTALGDRIYECLQLAQESLLGFYNSDAFTVKDTDEKIKISILVMLDTVCALAEAKLLRSSADGSWPYTGAFNVMTGPKTAQMVARGWCRSEVATFRHAYLWITARLYLQQMRRHDVGVDHSVCDDRVCRNMQISSGGEGKTDATHEHIDAVLTRRLGNTLEATMAVGKPRYKPKHVNTICTCDMLGPSRAAVARCLGDGTFPVLRVRGNTISDVKLDVVPYQDDTHTPYIALSHVWVDGLGNPEVTQLPRCQIKRLQGLLTSINGCTFEWGESGEQRREERELLLWCDTLCCPTEGEDKQSRQLALSKLRDVYEKATFVLVLDRELELIKFADTTVLEQAARLITSRWTKRLWTFQECALAKKLLIKLADRIIDFRDIYTGLHALRGTDPLSRYIAQAFMSRCIELRSWNATTANDDNSTNQVSLLMQAVCNRSVTEPADEPLCLAVALNVDIARVYAVDGKQISSSTFLTQIYQTMQDFWTLIVDHMRRPAAEVSLVHDRMQVFWQLMSNSQTGIPVDIVFNQFPRLSRAGYRWAPASFIGNPDAASAEGIIGGTLNPKAIWTADGLRCRKRAWRIRADYPAPGFTLPVSPIAKSIMVMRDVDGDFYSVACRTLSGSSEVLIWEYLQDRSKDWVLILDENITTGRIWRGLLTYAERKAKCVVYRSVAFASISRLPPDFQMFCHVNWEHAAEIRQHTALLRRLAWERFYEKLCGRMISWLPDVLGSRMRPLSQRLIRLFCQDASQQTQALFESTAEKASKSPQALYITQQGYYATHPPDWKMFILYSLIGHDGTVIESFDGTTEWIID